ncbi:glycosyltransferase family 4 protein [Tenacibaculum aiptasiae]|uniref:Glycosyltransferase family 4 protein n=1 Tax=Tenacibaculum aiptasiae TaxID=426481 RepID=A0A7J5A6T9_9FLAO|nr:glycosyltransferase [Tenacibaculum aiptasiae]KAB1153281.1 glycosyltransferase family 4 protein [Tenacibaculum aiptasiae]
MGRALIIVPNFGKGGAERVLSRVLLSLPKEDVKNISFLTLDHDLGYELPEDIEVIRLPHKRLKKALFSMIKVINKHDWKFVYSTLNHFNLILPLLVFRKRQTKLICRESILPITYYKSFGFMGKLLLFYYRKVMKAYDTVIVQSKDMLDEVQKLKIKTTFLINNPSPRYKLDVEKDRKYNFIYVARWHDQKNYELLIEFWKWIKDIKKDNSQLLCIGVGDRAIDLNKSLKDYNLEFINKHSDIESILNESQAYLNFSKYEGFSNSILEALSAGLPVFALDFLGGKEELLNFNNSVVSDIKSLNANKNDFEDIYKSFLEFKEKEWNRVEIKQRTDTKFEANLIIDKFKEVFYGKRF